jgi:hypothetical protein
LKYHPLLSKKCEDGSQSVSKETWEIKGGIKSGHSLHICPRPSELKGLLFKILCLSKAKCAQRC